MEKEKAIPGWNAIRQDLSPYLLVFMGVFLLLSLFSFAEGDDGSGANWFGRIGYYVSFTFFYLFGKSAFFLAGFSLILGVISFKNPDFDKLGKALFFPLFLIGTSVSLNILETPMGNLGDGGGIVGLFFSWLLNYLFGDTGRVIVVFFLYIYSAIVWLEDTAWSFSFHKINQISNSVYQMFGGKRDISHLKLPAFLQDWVSVKKIDSFEGNTATPFFPNKSWIERKNANEDLSPKMESFFDIEENANKVSESNFESSLYVEKKDKQVQSPRYRYKNTSLYHGFFEETGKVYRFHNASHNLQRKLNSEPTKQRLYAMKLVDFRGEKKEFTSNEFGSDEIFSDPIVHEEFVFEKSSIKPNLRELLPSVSDDSSLKKKSPMIDFSDLELYEKAGGEYSEDEEEEILDDEDESYFPEDLEDEEELVDLSENLPDNFEIDRVDIEPEEDVAEVINSDISEGNDSTEDLMESLPVVAEEILPPSNVYAMEKRKPKIEKPAEKEEFPLGSMVPSVKLKKGKYYISHKLFSDHRPTQAYSAKNEIEVETVIKKIEEIIGHFGVEVKVISKERGPIITRYELTIPYGVKLNKITTLVDEIRGHLEVTNVRIVAPIPGKSTIGIEVPNIHREDVFLSEILKDQVLQSKNKGLTISIGKDISGKIVNIDLAKLPHLLVAGTTGSGKSVSLNSMITSLICTRSPEEVRFIMIDPKMVEMTLYEDIPHLLMPVITDPRKANKALAWAIDEMESRYQIVSKLKSRDFKSYNEKVEQYAHAQGYQKFPYIVIFIDELADLMMVSGKELEEKIQRISQKSRAVGIHLVMATQRPSVDVITGLIKANCPARAAFKVAQKTDSRTILDSNGAESLLGKGDFLYRSPEDSDLIRIQAPFIEEKEIEAIVEEAKKQGAPAYIEIDWEEESSTETFDDEDEDLFDQAWTIVLTEKKASASYLQRRMRIGYNKAARLMELMEARGYVSPQIGAKPREILRSA
ncbi:MAG: DNA translocase FtsK 4TM domain-containing protein [Leptospira sp.]|nr:DNA translocase FtsK 4TM domain-containing protein [Leptospira sp.]